MVQAVVVIVYFFPNDFGIKIFVTCFKFETAANVTAQVDLIF